MSEPFPEALPAQLRRRGEVIAPIVDVSIFPAALRGTLMHTLIPLCIRQFQKVNSTPMPATVIEAKRPVWPRNSLMPTRRILLLIALFAFPCLSLAQQGGNLTQAYATADSELTAAYRQALSKFTPRNQEMMRRAQRAWLAFSECEKNLNISIVGGKPVAPESGREAIIGEVIIRRTHLQTFFAGTSVPTALPNVLQTQESALSKTYVECMSRLSDGDRLLLQQAERAWITYREADSASMLAAYGNPSIGTAAQANLTSTREAQIGDLIKVLNLKQGAGARSSIQEAPASGVQNNAANPEDAKAIAEYRNQAKALFKRLVAKKDDPFFKKPDGLRNLPEIPAEFRVQILQLSARYEWFSREPRFAGLLNSVANERATIDLLASCSMFTKLLKTGGVEMAGLFILRVLSQGPKAIPAEYNPIWESVARWNAVYRIEEPKFQDHLRKAKTFEDLGKSSDAIKEYQAAYEIIDSSAIAEKIKKVREQSLGL